MPYGATPGTQRTRLYQDLSWTWPIVSPPEHYRDEARQFHAFLTSKATIPVREVLHLGCGGGHVDSQLKRRVRITGVDLSPAMLRLARRLNPEVEYRLGDMRSARLGRTYDGAIISDAVSYMRTAGDLTRAFATAYRHLKPGAVLVTYAEHTPDRFEQNWTQPIMGRRGRDEIVFLENRYDPNPRDTTFESTFIFLIRRGSRLAVETDRHIMGLFPASTWKKALRDAGFRIRHAGPDPSDREGDDAPWFVGWKPG